MGKFTQAREVRLGKERGMRIMEKNTTGQSC